MPDINTIPDKIVDFNLYNAGEKYLGISNEIDLPSLEAMTSTLGGAGILGEIETPTPGHFSSMEMEIPFRMPTKQSAELAEPRRHVLTLRADKQSYVRTAGRLEHRGLKLTVGGVSKGYAPGKMSKGNPSEASVTLEVDYYKIEEAGEILLELDKLNSIYIVNGFDYYEEIRKNI